ncbi:MAG: hypothetical protein FJ100_10520 [Deltaproteobacteria bacterium]|nr:hypothetical protein [Deltaproteobacteria bacterium]
MNGPIDQEAALRALRAWVAALNAYGNRSATGRVMADEVVIERGGFGAERGRVVQTIRGLDAANAWLRMTRHVVTFSADEATLHSQGRGWSARYRLTAPDDFCGGGLWQFELDGHGRIVRLQHWPDDLPDGP